MIWVYYDYVSNFFFLSLILSVHEAGSSSPSTAIPRLSLPSMVLPWSNSYKHYADYSDAIPIFYAKLYGMQDAEGCVDSACGARKSRVLSWRLT